MRNKILIGFLIGLTSFNVFSQTDETGKVSFGLRAGFNLQNINGKDVNGTTLKLDLVPKYNFGVNVEIPIVPDFYLQPNLLFATKGAAPSNATINISYLELPVNFIYKPLLGKGHLLLGFGPYLAYAVGGNVRMNGSSEKIIFKSTQSPSDAGTVLRPFDAGGNGLFGYEFANKISLQLNAQLGLVNIAPSNNGNIVFKNTGFGISAGYRF
ncbi:MAG: PorT family protein [Opitutaceae bacterium]|nr:PorT family protein [Cytophagales bacterium]